MRRLWFALLVFTMGTNLVIPFFPVYQSEYHMDSPSLTLLFAVYAVTLLPALLIAGSLSDQIGRKIVLVPSMIVMALASLVYAISHSPLELFVGRGLQGVATGVFLGTCTAFMVDRAGERRVQILRLASLTTMIGFGLGPAISGLFLQYVPWHPMQTPFLLHVLLMLIAIAGSLTVPESVSPAESIRWSVRVGVPPSLRRPFLRFIGPAGLIFFALTGTVIALVPSFTIQVLHEHNDAVVGGLILLMMVSGGVAQWVTPDRRLTRMTQIGLLCAVLGTLLFILSGEWRNTLLLFLAMVVEGVGNGLAFKGGLGLAGQLGEGDVRARVISSYYVAAYIGFSVPVFGGGLLVSRFGMIEGLFILTIALGLCVGWVVAGSQSVP